MQSTPTPPHGPKRSMSRSTLLVVWLIYMTSHVILRLLRNKLTAIGTAFVTLFLTGVTQSWTMHNWVQLILTLLFVYGVSIVLMHSFMTSSEKELVSQGLHARDGKCPRPF